MSRIDNNGYLRSSSGAPDAVRFSVRLPLLIFVSLALIVLSRLENATVANLRAELQAVAAPVLAIATVPLDPARRLAQQIGASYAGFAELEQLRGENQRLRQWEGRAKALEQKVAELATLAKAMEEQEIRFRTVRVIATSSGAFVQSALLEGGAEAGITTGLPVINAAGVLGRIVEAGRRTSRVLLLTDISSRIPVFVGEKRVRAVLAGDNGAEPRLMFLPRSEPIADGDEITTSGLGGIFPRGLRVGSVIGSGPRPRARLYAAVGNLEYASVLLYENPGRSLAAELRAAGHAPRRNGQARRN